MLSKMCFAWELPRRLTFFRRCPDNDLSVPLFLCLVEIEYSRGDGGEIELLGAIQPTSTTPPPSRGDSRQNYQSLLETAPFNAGFTFTSKSLLQEASSYNQSKSNSKVSAAIKKCFFCLHACHIAKYWTLNFHLKFRKIEYRLANKYVASMAVVAPLKETICNQHLLLCFQVEVASKWGIDRSAPSTY